jgi:hypothetical protein
VLVPGRLSQALASREWKGIQERFRDRRIVAFGGIAFAGSQFVFAGYSGDRFQEYPHHRALHPSWQGADPADCRGAESGFGVKKLRLGRP